MITSRRRFLLGASTTLVAAPAIVRVAANLMPVSSKALQMDFATALRNRMDLLPPYRILYVHKTVYHGMYVQALRDRNVLLTINDAALSELRG
jgi:hypothetical protein